MKQIIDKEICTTLNDRQMNYSVYVAKHRAIPSLYDGLKPVYRRILFTMKDTTKLTKSANIEGRVMELHPHGSSYPTIVTMTQKDTNITPLIDGKGNFGQHTSKDIQYSSSRYSEVKISDYALDMMRGLDSNIVDLVPSYDGEKIEPVNLPVRHPLILTLAQQGLAVGFATDIPSFNLKEVCEATVSYLRGEDIPILYPDFATHGYIVKDNNIMEQINKTGRGTFKIRGRYEVDGNSFLIKEIPYTTTREDIINKVIAFTKVGKFKEVIDINDNTDINGLEVEIILKKGTKPEQFAEKLYQLTTFECTYSCNMNMLIENEQGEVELKVLGVQDIIPLWCEWRGNCIKRTLYYSIKETEKKLHLLEGLKQCLINVDEVVTIIRSTSKEVEEAIMDFLKVDREQATYICKTTIKDINVSKIQKKIQEIEKLESKLTQFKKEVEDEECIKQYIIQGLQDTVRKYAKPRFSQVIEATQTKRIHIVEDYNCVITITSQGYLKKNLRHGVTGKVKDEDYIIQELSANNRGDILFFTNKGNVYYYKVDNIDLTGGNSLGLFIPNIIPLEEDEEIIYTYSTTDYKGVINFAFENGKVAVISLSAYKCKTNRTKITNAYNMTSPLVAITIGQENTVCMADNGKVFIADMTLANPKQSRASQGITIMKLKEDSKLTKFYPLSKIKDNNIEGAITELIEYYGAKNLGKVGNYLRPEDRGVL